MIEQYKFKTINEYTDFFRNNKVSIAEHILESIDECFHSGDCSKAEIVEVILENKFPLAYILSIDKEEWINALESSIKIFTENNKPDHAIDAFFLKEKIAEYEEIVSGS